MRIRVLAVLALSALCVSSLSGCGKSGSATEPSKEPAVQVSAASEAPSVPDAPSTPDAPDSPTAEEIAALQEKYDQIKRDMTIEEVREIMGHEFREAAPLNKDTDGEIRRYYWYTEPDGGGYEIMVSTQKADDGQMRVRVKRSDVPV